MTNSEPNMELVAAFNAKENWALEEIYRSYYHRLYFTAKKLTEDHHDAEDATMDTLTKLLERDRQFDSLGQLEGFLFATVRNTVINGLRKKATINDFAYKTMMAESKANVEWDKLESEIIFKVKQALELLPEKKKIVLDLLYFHEAKSQEAAEFMKVSRRTVERYHSEALEIIREIFSKLKPLETISIFGFLLAMYLLW